jgi:hypothetical protein
MTEKSRTHIFKSLTPLKPPVEKTVNLHGIKQVCKPRSISVVFSQVDQNSMAMHISPEVTVKGFKKCCISNAADGIDDGMLWNDSEGC